MCFSMEIFFLSYVNKLCVYPRLCLSSSRFYLRLRTYNDSKNQCFTHGNVLLSYVNEPMYLLGNLSFFKIQVDHFMAQDDAPCAIAISK